ncbi:DNA-binding domain-containing protein [Motiliproteus sp.]|uniref:DNA-binding domain-containing protein n=1 Tax=Motiliproteus sp. TaxID=1898955 RepID=UPI003BAC17B9
MLTDQQRLIAAIFADEGSDRFEPKGLAIYQRNLKATARRALKISFPTVAQLIGEALFQHAADRLLLTSPPQEGDWGLWGSGFADLLDQLSELEAYPYVGDCARLDFAVHRMNRTQSAPLDLSSLSLLGSEPTEQLRLQFNQAVRFVESAYPIVDIWVAHQAETPDPQEWFTAAKKKMQRGQGQSGLIYRVQQRTEVRQVGVAEQRWINSLRAGNTLSVSLDLAQSSDFDFEAWLPMAVSQNLITEIHSSPQ